MSNEMYVYTSWDTRNRAGRVTYSIMIVGFESEGSAFTVAIDSVMESHVPKMASTYKKWVVFQLNRSNGNTRFCSQFSPYTINFRPSNQSFHVRESSIRRLVPKDIRELLESYDYEVAAILVESTVAEIYIISFEPSEAASQSIMNLSQIYTNE